MNGRLVAGFIVAVTLVAGVAIYYLQVYAFYHDVPSQPGRDVLLVSRESGEPEPIAYADFRAIDSESSPIRYRACFTIRADRAALAESYETLDEAIPRNAPGWFDCFDARAIGEALEAGEAVAFLSGKNIHYGVDRIVAILPDGRGYAWHELNNCGEKAYDGTVIGEECPPRPETK